MLRVFFFFKSQYYFLFLFMYLCRNYQDLDLFNEHIFLFFQIEAQLLKMKILHHIRWSQESMLAAASPRHRSQLWASLRALSSFTAPLSAIDDFNSICFSNEKLSLRPPSSLRYFNEFISDTGLIDPGFTGHPYTWANNRRGSSCVIVRLDRALINGEWSLFFRDPVLHHLTRYSCTNSFCTI